MNARLIVIAILSVLIVGIIAVAFLFSGPAKPKPTNPITLPDASSRGGPTIVGASILLPVGSGTSITTKDFLKDPATVADPQNTGHYHLGYHLPEDVPDPTATENPPYVIEYQATTHFFSIVLFEEPLSASRLGAEQYLMAHLGISQEQMCLLKYQVGVPNAVNPQYAGRDLRFSFCQGATVLP